MITDWDRTLKEMGWDPHAKAAPIPDAAHSTNQPESKRRRSTPALMVLGPLAGLVYIAAIPLIALFAIPFMLIRKAFYKDHGAEAYPHRI